jgi:aromatic-L-amino-acid decarboxylase
MRPLRSGAVTDYRDWQVPLGRRFRALKLWMVIRHYGAEGLRAHVRRTVELARELAGAVDAEPGFERVGEPDLGLVCFRLRAADDVNRALLAAVNADPSVFLTSTVLDGRFTLRASIGGVRTERRHVVALWDRVRESAATIAGRA